MEGLALRIAATDATAVLRDTHRTNLNCVPTQSRRGQKKFRVQPCPDATAQRNRLRHKLRARCLVLLQPDGRWAEREVLDVESTLRGFARMHARLVEDAGSAALLLEHPKRGTLVYAATPPCGKCRHVAWPHLTTEQQSKWAS